MLILGIETSCDDTSIAIIEKQNTQVELLSMVSFSQVELLRKWGGVVPEIAARNHLEKITPLLRACLGESKKDISEVDCYAVTTHPGLLGPLLTGLNAAKTLAMYYEKPIVPVNHLYAHLEAIHLTENISYPYLGLLVSGGHSLYLLVESAIKFTVLGTTIDDAAGEAFDKGGKLLGLGYPAGRIIDELAKNGDPSSYSFPIALKGEKKPLLSYSGLKTSLRNLINDQPSILEQKPDSDEADDFPQIYKDICASYQSAIVIALSQKLKKALSVCRHDFNLRKLPIVVGGGVACNSFLRSELIDKFQDVHFVAPKYCTDNAAMVANYAARISDQAIDYPACLEMDAKSRYINKNDYSGLKK